MNKDIKKLSVYERELLAKNKRTAKYILEKLSEDEHYSVRCNIAKNPHLSAETLVKLSRDEDEYVRWSVANNKLSPLITVFSIFNRDVLARADLESMTKRRISFIFGINKRPKYTIPTRKYRNKFSNLNIWNDNMINNFRAALVNNYILNV